MKIYCKSKNWELNKKYDIDKILYLLIDNPTYISSSNNFIWENKKSQYHRNYDLPSYIFHDGYTVWYKNDLSQKTKNQL